MVTLTLGETGWKVYGEALYYFFITLLQVYKFKIKSKMQTKQTKASSLTSHTVNETEAQDYH